MGKFQAIAWTIALLMALQKKAQNCGRKIEDSFYNYLTMGLLKTLSGLMRVCRINYEKRIPCTDQEILHWEQCQGVFLPSNMRSFYSTVNGFSLHWSFDYGDGDIRRVGFLRIPRLHDIRVLITTSDFGEDLLQATQNDSEDNSKDYQCLSPKNGGEKTKDDMDLDEDLLEDFGQPKLCKDSKIFAMHSINDQALVCMIYENGSDVNPKFFLLELGILKWKFLASSFIEYWRMCIVHLGLPYWELIYSSISLPSWVEQLFLLLAPHLLTETEPRLEDIMKSCPQEKLNEIDHNIFFEQSDKEDGKTEENSNTKL